MLFSLFFITFGREKDSNKSFDTFLLVQQSLAVSKLNWYGCLNNPAIIKMTFAISRFIYSFSDTSTSTVQLASTQPTTHA